MSRETVNVRINPTCVLVYTVLDPGWCKDCQATVVWSRTPRGRRAPLDPWDRQAKNPETVVHFATCAAKRRRRTTPAVTLPSPATEAEPPAAPPPTITELQCQALEAILQSFGMRHAGWTCAQCGLGGDDGVGPSQADPVICGVCAEEVCWRCGNEFADEDDQSPDHPGLCSWCADQWDDD
jgi:hypothetical protein